MKELRRRFNRFCYNNRHKGIPNLMMYIVLGTLVVYVMSMLDRSNTLYALLTFDRQKILQGQVWRLVTYPLTYHSNNILLMGIAMLCYFSLGRAIEHIWGTFRFNLFYLSGVFMMDVFCMLTGMPATVDYLNLSLLLSYATLFPNSQFLMFYIIPIKAWVLALFNLGLIFYDVIRLTMYGFFPLSLYPIISLANYFLFFGKDIMNVFPLSWRANASRLFRRGAKRPTAGAKPIPFPKAGSYQAETATVKAPYTHRCTVCGKTDLTNPELEFRYCSRCKGYFCYCQDHISNHAHIQ